MTSLNGDANGGRLFTLGGGLRVDTHRQLVLEAGVQVMQRGNDPIYGLGLSYRFSRDLPR